MRRAAPVLALSVLLAACGYFNSLYNAQRRFNDGERAAREGNRGEAISAYSDAVARAAVSYRKHPDSRWSDDALLLIGRARFAMGQHEAARGALGRVIEQSSDREIQTTAALYLGAAFVRLGHPDSALAPLATGLDGAGPGSELHALGRLWLGRARLAVDDQAGWSDLEFVGGRHGALAIDALLELVERGLATNDSARTLAALTALTDNGEAETRLDSIIVLVHRAGRTWNAAAVAAALPPQPAREWEAEARTRVRFERASLLARAGDTTTAIAEALAAAEQSTGPRAGDARNAAAGWLLARADSIEDLARVRAVLLPALAHAVALQRVRHVRTLDVLLERARGGQVSALFAAAEFARDTLRSPRLARQLFLTYADVAASTVWAPKALLAALPLSSAEQRPALERRILEHADNPYVAAVQGHPDAAAYYAAEERLGGAVSALRADAAAAALSGDLRVGRAVAVFDSLRNLAHSDSLRLQCGSLLDSLTLRGIRADSVRVACLRSDTASVARYLALDTLRLRDSVTVEGARGRAGGDTLSSP